MKPPWASPTRTKGIAPGRRIVPVVSPEDRELMDYSTVPVGWRILGHLTSGHVTKSTVRCGKCGRVGLLATKDEERLIVHRGRVSNNTLFAIDYCEILHRSH